MRPICLLWDIDGTLLNTRGAGVQPLEAAIGVEFNMKVQLERGKYSGYTDFEIIADLTSTTIQDPIFAHRYEMVLDNYTLDLESALAQNPAVSIGQVRNVISELNKVPGCTSFIGTGNYHAAALKKLESAGFSELFDSESIFGASVNRMQRPEIIKHAKESISDQFQIIVIGDAPADIQAARINELDVISVATGHHKFDELNRLNPGYVLDEGWNYSEFICLLDSISS